MLGLKHSDMNMRAFHFNLQIELAEAVQDGDFYDLYRQDASDLKDGTDDDDPDQRTAFFAPTSQVSHLQVDIFKIRNTIVIDVSARV